MGRDLVSLYMWHYGDCLFIFEDGRPSNFRWMGYLYECLWFSMTFWYSESERARAWRTWFAKIACSYDDYNLLPSIPGLIEEVDILTWSRPPTSNIPKLYYVWRKLTSNKTEHLSRRRLHKILNYLFPHFPNIVRINYLDLKEIIGLYALLCFIFMSYNFVHIDRGSLV